MAKKATKSGQDALEKLLSLAGSKPKPGKTKIPVKEIDSATAIRNWYHGSKLRDLAEAMVSNAEDGLSAIAEQFRREQCLSTHSVINSVILKGETQETPPIVSLHVTPRIAEIIKETLSGNSEDDAIETLHQIKTETMEYAGEIRVTQTLRFTNLKPECIADLKKNFDDDFDNFFDVNNFIKINASKLTDEQRLELAEVISSVLKKNKIDPSDFMSSEVKVEPTDKFKNDVMTDEDTMRTWERFVEKTGFCALQKPGFHSSGRV